jgi:hypothetical protein
MSAVYQLVGKSDSHPAPSGVVMGDEIGARGDVAEAN